MTRRLSSLEVLLSVVATLLLICCVGLIVISYLSLKPEGAVEPVQLTGQMVIKQGAEFSEELKNSSSLQFKSLAFDIQKLVSEAFSLSELKQVYKFCQVQHFSQGSVVVTFDLWFDQLVEAQEAEQQLEAGLQDAEGGGLVIDRNSIHITGDSLRCPGGPGLCDCVSDQGDTSLSTGAVCFSCCLYLGRRRMEHTVTQSCGVLRVDTGLSIQLDFRQFETEESIDTLRLYEGIGLDKLLTAELSGSTPPGTVWLLTDQSTVEFASDDIITLPGFKATYSAANMSSLSSKSCVERRAECSRRTTTLIGSEPAAPPSPQTQARVGTTRFYIVTPVSPSQQPSSFRIHSLPLAPPTRPMCLSFWYHMFGENVHRLRVLLLLAPTQTESTATVLFQKDGNYGNTWNYGQVTLNLTSEATVTFEALKKGGFLSDIALDDITLTSDACGPAPPEPTNNLCHPPTSIYTLPESDCGGPFNLWEPNSTFSSPNYPQSYGNEAECVWTLHAAEGHNIQLHFLDFDIEATFDVVEVRDGAGLNSTLLAVLTGSDGPAHDLFSTANQMTVRFFTDESGFGRGFKANFTSGVDLGAPAPCAGDQFQCQTGSCVHGNSLCDGAVDCPDASDEQVSGWLAPLDTR
uniref:Transmembrane serine protease 15 n=1 Tax=Stegastes partitus TaxID=144197 RepID=A0A3B5A6W0_9TELE